jgi:2-methylcitrate dehydratase PrpD
MTAEAPSTTEGVAALAAAVAETDIRSVPDQVRVRVLDLLVDTLAVAALGSARPELFALTETIASVTPDGPATAVGSARGWPVATAAFLNGCAVAADQLQDGHRIARGHPASHVVPAVFALAEAVGATVDDLLSAVLAGYEVGVRVGRAMGGTPAGVHDIGTWGQVGVSAGVARLLAPGDADAARRAVELSASAVLLTDADTVFGGHTRSHVFLGAAVQHGLNLGLSAVAGLMARLGALERHLVAVAGVDPAAVDSDWQTFEVLGGYLKDHPTCAHLHGVNDVVADLVADGVTADGVESVEVDVFAGAARFDRVADSELAARFSVPTTVAVALTTGRLDETTMTDAIVTSAPVRALAERVRVRHDSNLDSGYPDGRPARTTITFTDGSQRTAEAGRPRWDGDRVPPAGATAAKARRLLEHRFGARAEAVADTLLAAPGDRPAAELGRALRKLTS